MENKRYLQAWQLKLGWLVKAESVRSPEHEIKRVGFVHLIAKAFVHDDLPYIGEQIVRLVEDKIKAGESIDEWDLKDILINRLEPVVMLRLLDGSFWYWVNQSYEVLSECN